MRNLRGNKKVNTTGVALLIGAIVFAAILPVRPASSYHSHKYAYQTQLENLAISANSEWQKAPFSVKVPLIGTTWSRFDQERASESVLNSDALDVKLNEYSPHFVTPTIHAP